MARRNSDKDWSERHGIVVREAAPEVPAFTEGEGSALWRQIETSAMSAGAGRSRWKAVVAGFVAVAVVGVGGAATAGVFSAHTGSGPVDAEDVELGGPGERLDPAAPDFAAVVDEVTADIRFPSVESRNLAVSWEAEDLSSDAEPSSVSTGALRLWTAGHALCSWSNTWAVALSTGDAAAANQAADVILGARNWPSITDTDPDMANESEFAWLPDLEQAIQLRRPGGGQGRARRPRGLHAGARPGAGIGQAMVKAVATRTDVEELFRRHAGELRGYLYRRAGQGGADLLGEVFVVALQRLGDLPEPELRRAWLFGTARRLLMAAERNTRQRQQAESERARFREAAADASDVGRSDRVRAVRDALAILTGTGPGADPAHRVGGAPDHRSRDGPRPAPRDSPGSPAPSTPGSGRPPVTAGIARPACRPRTGSDTNNPQGRFSAIALTSASRLDRDRCS